MSCPAGSIALILILAFAALLMVLVFGVGAVRRKPGYRRKRPDPNYGGPERRN